MEAYRQAIQANQINPVAHWDGQASQQIFDPSDPNTPLDHLGLGVYKVNGDLVEDDSGENEILMIPIEGQFEVCVAGRTFVGARPGGPFATQPESSNASAIYIGRDSEFAVTGHCVMLWFSTPANGDKPAAFIKPGGKKQVGRGQGVWYRGVTTLATTDDVSTNLIAGETYSPPGLWSGTPLHTHDQDAIASGESDHEEIYYHVSRLTEGAWGPYGVQLLFDDKGLDKAYLVHNHDAIAIPGAAHPVVAGPVSDMIYFWALASDKPSELKMRDVPEFAYLKRIETILAQLEAERPEYRIDANRLAELADKNKLEGHQRHMLKQHLIERGFTIEY